MPSFSAPRLVRVKRNRDDRMAARISSDADAESLNLHGPSWHGRQAANRHGDAGLTPEWSICARLIRRGHLGMRVPSRRSVGLDAGARRALIVKVVSLDLAHQERQIRTFTAPAVVHRYPDPPDRADGRNLDHRMRDEPWDARA